MQNIIIVTLGDDMSFASIQELAHAIEMWRGVQKVEFKDVAAQPSVHPTASGDERLAEYNQIREQAGLPKLGGG